MTDFLTRLAQRQLGEIATIEPRLPAFYASVSEEWTPRTNIETRSEPAVGVEPTPASKIDTSARQKQSKDPPTSLEQQRRAAVLPTEPSGLVDAKTSHKSPLNGNELKQTKAGELLLVDSHARRSIDRVSSPEQTERAGGNFQLATAQLVITSRKNAPVFPPRLIEQKTTRVTALAQAGTKWTGLVPQRLSSNPDRLQAGAKPTAEPPVQVSIGRIEVTAVSTQPAAKRTPSPRKPSMSLDDYLARRTRRDRE